MSRSPSDPHDNHTTALKAESLKMVWFRADSSVRKIAVRRILNQGGSYHFLLIPTAMVKAWEACEFLKQSTEMNLGHVLEEIYWIFPWHRFASVREGMEMAMIDEVACSVNIGEFRGDQRNDMWLPLQNIKWKGCILL
ncbi:hypothetical protein Bca4012_083863 [Brassica carinata]